MTTYQTFFIFDRDWAALPPSWFARLSAGLSERFPRLDAKVLRPEAVTSHALPFWSDHELIRISGFNQRRLYPAYFIAKPDSDSLMYLDGGSEPIHHLNAMESLTLDEENVRQYLMFFCFFVHGDEGGFLILDANNSLPVRRLRAALKKEDAAPMAIRRRDDDGWEMDASLAYGRGLYRAVFSVKRSGLVEMLEDTPLDKIAPGTYQPRRFPDLSGARAERAKPRIVPAASSEAEATAEGDRPAEAGNTILFLRMRELANQLKASAADNARQPVLQRYYETLEATRGRLPIHTAPASLDSLRALSQKYPNFAELIAFVSDEVTLATLLKGGCLQLPPLVVDGEPGVGKTRFLHDLANTLGIHLETLDMASATAGFELSGSSSVWRGGRPGLVLEAIVRARYANPMILLDELDKVPRQDSSPIDGPLHALLEPVTASRFRDEYLKVRADFSYVNWIATCNDFAKLSLPIQSRFIRFQIKPPSQRQLPIVIQSIYVDLLHEQRIGHAFVDSLASEVVIHLASHVPTPRRIRTLLRKAIVAAAVRTHRTQPNEPLCGIAVDVADLLMADHSMHAEAGETTYLM